MAHALFSSRIPFSFVTRLLPRHAISRGSCRLLCYCRPAFLRACASLRALIVSGRCGGKGQHCGFTCRGVWRTPFFRLAPELTSCAPLRALFVLAQEIFFKRIVGQKFGAVFRHQELLFELDALTAALVTDIRLHAEGHVG